MPINYDYHHYQNSPWRLLSICLRLFFLFSFQILEYLLTLNPDVHYGAKNHQKPSIYVAVDTCSEYGDDALMYNFKGKYEI